MDPAPADPLSQKLTGNPDPSMLADGTINPIKAVRIRKKNPVELEANIVLNYDPATGAYTHPTLYNVVTGAGETQRSMTTWKKAGPLTTLGDQTVWTPAAGKAVRLLGLSIVVDPATTTTAGSVVTLKDITNVIVYDYLVNLGIAAAAINRIQAPLSPNGYKFPPGAAIGINLSAAALAGGVYINMWGCEE